MILESKNLVAPEAIGIVYSRDFRNLVKQMIKDYKSLIDIYHAKKDQIAIDADESTVWAKLDSIEIWAKAQGFKVKNKHVSSTRSGYIDVFLPVKSAKAGTSKWVTIRVGDHWSKQGKIDYVMTVSPNSNSEILLKKLEKLRETSANNSNYVIETRKSMPRQTTAAVWLTTDIQDRLELLGKKWEERFAVWAENQSPRVVKRVLKTSDTQIKRALIHFYSGERLELIGQVIPTPLKQSMKMHIIENVSLIKSVQSQYHERIVGAVSRSITNAGSIKSLTEEIYKYGDMSMRRANLIALDQTRKMYSNLTIRRFEQVGITKVKWLHTHKKETARPYHIRQWDGVSGLKDGHPNGLNGFIFDIDKPPVIQEATKTQPEIRGYPAQLPFCQCVMRAIIEE